LECLSDAYFLGKLLMLPTNVRLDWKGFPRKNALAYWASSTLTKGKSFITLTPEVEDHPAVGVQNLLQSSRVRRFWGEGVVDAEDGNVPLCAPLLQVELVGLGRLK
jgi:hypothetical protein